MKLSRGAPAIEVEGSLVSAFSEIAPEPLRRFEIERSRMVELLGLALLLSQDPGVRARLASAGAGVSGPGSGFAMALHANRTWLKVGNSGDVVALRSLPVDVPIISFDDLSSKRPDLFLALQTSPLRVKALADADTLLQPLFEMGSVMTRQQYRAISCWSSLLEQRAYACHTNLVEYTDSARPSLLATINQRRNVPGALGMYWWAIHTMGNMVMLSSDAQAGSWLADMSAQFEWQGWTPTFALLRERTTWLAAIAARSVMAFGPPVVDSYLKGLSQLRHPMKVFDALFGLVAIAVGHPADAGHIAAGIERVREAHLPRVSDHSEYFVVAYTDALRVIAMGTEYSPTILKDHGLPSTRGFATKAAFASDPAALARSGRLVGFEILPAVALTDPEQHYAVAAVARREAALGERMIEGILRNAWGDGERSGETLQ